MDHNHFRSWDHSFRGACNLRIGQIFLCKEGGVKQKDKIKGVDGHLIYVGVPISKNKKSVHAYV